MTGDRPLRLLVCDAYDRDGREVLVKGGCHEAGTLYAETLRRVAPGATTDVAYPADPDWRLPAGVALADYDGVVWTGSSLTIHREGDERVRRELELTRAAFAAGVPSFGSCWAAQLAAVAAGGRCAENPKGREFGVARKIALSDAGRSHPLYEGKPAVFDAFASHVDEVAELPPGGTLLASNRTSRVQALAIDHAAGTFWAVQYHPEYDLREIARLAVVRAQWLVAQGSFRDPAAVAAWAAELETLHDDPSRSDIAYRHGLDPDVLDPDVRTAEVRNWIRCQALPSAARRS